MVLKGYFDGKRILLDEPIPEGLPSNVHVRVTVEPDVQKDPFDQIADLAVKGGLPPDFSQQHEHYTKGTPRK